MSDSRIYLFYIKGKNNKKYYLTSASESFTYNGNKYLPYSGLNLSSATFNDSATNHILLYGIFEQDGISQNDDIKGADIEIMYLYNEKVIHLVSYICTQHNIRDLDFEIRCEPESIKYNQSLLQMFSKTCRANFGDNRCKVNKHDYSLRCNLLNVSGNKLICDIKEIDDQYFKGGTVIVGAEKNFHILAHYNNVIEVEAISGEDFKGQNQVILVPTCDKKFRTCCYSFDNAVNFRGEPMIPEFNIIKN